MKLNLLDLLVMMKKAEQSQEIKAYLDAEENAPFGWVSKDSLKEYREKAEASIAPLQVQLDKLLAE